MPVICLAEDLIAFRGLATKSKNYVKMSIGECTLISVCHCDSRSLLGGEPREGFYKKDNITENYWSRAPSPVEFLRACEVPIESTMLY